MPRIENWSIRSMDNIYTAPECKVKILAGDIFGHPNPFIMEGEPSTTSPLLALDLAHRWARTRNTQYELGVPDRMYIEYVKRSFPSFFTEIENAGFFEQVSQ